MSRWKTPEEFGHSARWECTEDGCEAWGGHGGDTQRVNVRRTKADARDHTDETGHATTVHVLEGAWSAPRPAGEEAG